MIDKRKTVQQYSSWLNAQDWDYFATLTTKYPITLKSARRLMTKFADTVCSSDGDMLFWVAEHFEVRDGYHVHALVKSRIDSNSIWNWWFKRYGRAEIEKYYADVGAAGYVSKYVTKAVADYDIELGKKLLLF